MRNRDLTVLPLRVPPELKESIRDRARIESIPQAEVIRRALHQYVISPIHGGQNRKMVESL